MFKKTIMNVLRTLTPEEKEELRKTLAYDAANTPEPPKDGSVAEESTPQNDGEAQGKANAESEEKDLPADDSEANTTPANNAENNDMNAEGKQEDPEPTANSDAAQPQAGVSTQVDNTTPTGNGVRIEDLVTTEILNERIAALEAKLDAVIDENTKLKDKYENPDFGTGKKHGAGNVGGNANNGDAGVKDSRVTYESFDEYSKRFM